MKLMLAFVAGIFMVFIGFSMLNGLNVGQLGVGYAGVAICLAGVVLTIGALIYQAKQAQRENDNR